MAAQGPCQILWLWDALLAGDAVAYRKRVATVGTTAAENFAAILGGHSHAEAMLVHSPAVGGLECSFHRGIWCLCLLLSFGVQN